MDKLIIAWEIGAGLGHLSPIRQICERAIARNTSVSVVTHAVDSARQLLPVANDKIISAPQKGTPPRRFTFSRNYAENLLRNGYWHAESLQRTLGWWLEFLQTEQPDYVLCDYSPTALLAAKQLGLRRGVLGYGYFVPPFEDPMPSIQPWLNLPNSYFKESERNCLATINPALRQCGWQSLSAVRDIFSGADRFVTTYPDCDHYPIRDEPEYYGPILNTHTSHYCDRNKRNAPTVFVYLTGDCRHFTAIFECLTSLNCTVLAFVRDIRAQQFHAVRTANVTILDRLVDLREVAAHCDFAITHGGNGTVTALLAEGLPILIFPVTLEHALFAYRLSQRGLAFQVSLFNSDPNVLMHIERMLSAVPPENLQAFATQCNKYKTEQTADNILDLVLPKSLTNTAETRQSQIQLN